MGTVVISLDAELAWGFNRYSPPSPNGLAAVRAARHGWLRLVDMFDRHAVPATWAIVGRIFEESTEVRNYQLTPDPIDWQDRALIDRVIEADVDHEIGFHSYTHLDFTSDEADSNRVDWELKKCREVADSVGIDGGTFVFPSNGIAYRDRLARHGFVCYRGRAQRGQGPRTRRLQKLSQLVGGRPLPPMVTPAVDEWGLVNVPASLYLYGFEGTLGKVLSGARPSAVVDLVKGGVERAVDTDEIFHLWFHPNDLRTNEQVERLAAILDYVARQRDRGRVETKTMGQIASAVLEDRGGGTPASEGAPKSRVRTR